MSSFVNFKLHNNNFLLTAARTVFWQEERILILSDLHLGKTGHFRKSGIAVPQTIFKEDMQRLVSQLQYYKPLRVIIVGDLFHSTDNKEHELFLKWRKDMPGISIQLVKGNHDILEADWYRQAGIEVHGTSLMIGNFVFAHDIETYEQREGSYCFCGHIHPGIKIKGAGRQSLQLACFYFGKKFAILPAFGKFTGTHAVSTTKGDAVFALVENKVMQVQ